MCKNKIKLRRKIVKKYFCIIMLILVLPLSVFSDEGETEEIWWGSYYMPGNFAFSIKGAFESNSELGGAVALYPCAEYLFYKPIIGVISPFDIGAAAVGRFGIQIGGEATGISAGAGLFGTFHLGFKGLEFTFSEYLQGLDLFSNIGVVYDFIAPEGDAAELKLGLGTFSGANYYITESIAVTLGYSSWRGFGGPMIGAVLKLGPGQEVVAKDFSFEKPGFGYMPYIAQFQALYWYAFAIGGYMFDDSSYKEGDGTIWAITSADTKEGEKLLVERALLKINADGTKWWKVKFTDDENEKLVYEFLVDPEHRLLKLRYMDEDAKQVQEYTVDPAKDESWGEVDVLTQEDYAEWVKEKKTIKVKAGKFQTDYIVNEYKDDKAHWIYEWWISTDVPGYMVKYHWKDSDKDELIGELIKITKNNKSEFNSF